MLTAPAIPKSLSEVLTCSSDLRDVKRLATRRGWTVREIGEGCYRTAYMVTMGRKRGTTERHSVVIKWHSKAACRWPAEKVTGHIRKAPCRRYGKWQVQHYYSPVPQEHPVLDIVMQCPGDLHGRNIGLDPIDNTVVAFDW